MARLHVHFLPELVPADALAASTCLVVDVLRATTSIVYALASNAREVFPYLTVEEARAAARGDRQGSLLCGERGGLRIEGFDLGNSPLEFSAENVAGRSLLFTTTNGTKALLHCRQASQVLLASFLNVSALCRRVFYEANVDIVCSGTDGEITREDVILAGAIVERMLPGRQCNDQATIARETWQHSIGSICDRADQDFRATLAAVLRDSAGGRNLIQLGLERDIDAAADVDRFDVVPSFDAASGRITLAR